jgi:hypothetical protein
VPPLRERREDIPLFIGHFASHFARLYGRPSWRPEPRVLERLIAHSWPGNVRQLAQTIQRMYVFEGHEETVLSDLFMTEAAQGDIAGVSPSAIVGVENLGEIGTADDAALLGAEPAVPLLNLGELRRLAVRQAMRLTKGHRGRAAELLYTGRALAGPEAERWGFFNRLVAPEALLSDAQSLAGDLASGPTFANAMTKRMLEMEWAMSVNDAIEAEAVAQALCMTTEDFGRAYRAFAAKQRPVFEGN